MKNRMAASNASARQRRVFRLAESRARDAQDAATHREPSVPAAINQKVLPRKPALTTAALLCALCLSGLVTFLMPDPASSAPIVTPLPDNATAGRYGSHWECADGFQRINDGCSPVEAPANGHLDG